MTADKSPTLRSWLTSDRPVPRLVARPVREFLDTEIAGGVILLLATAIALVWANSPWRDSYQSLWTIDLSVGLGDLSLAQDLRGWINDAAMAIFFFVVGLEIKRELYRGELSSARRAALPAIAALGGMVVPALIYLAINAGGAGSHGWGIPMATDIAFAIGVLALFGSRLPSSLRVFLLSLAIADDVGAILVIAIFYTAGIDVLALVAAAGLLVAMLILRRIEVRWMPVYVALGTGVWLATFLSGVHATIAGVVLGLLAPAEPFRRHEEPLPRPAEGEGVSAALVRAVRLRSQERVAITERLEHLLHPYTSYLIIPVFALANAGLPLAGDDLADGLGSPVTLGIVAGLILGKFAGITAFSYVGRRLGLAELPAGVSWLEIAAVAAVAGVGFTVSLFIAGLAFDEPALVAEAKIGILAGSLLAALGGSLLLLVAARRHD